jgi:hypothetical protein
MSSLMVVITFARITSAEGGGQRHGRMGEQAQKLLWLIILLLGKLHKIEKDLNEILSRAEENITRKHQAGEFGKFSDFAINR